MARPRIYMKLKLKAKLEHIKKDVKCMSITQILVRQKVLRREINELKSAGNGYV